MKTREQKAVLIYDGNCPVCSQSIEWIRGHARRGAFEMLPCQAGSRKERFPFIEDAACMQAMQLILPGGKVLSGAQAVPEILNRLRHFSFTAAFFALPGSMSLARVFYQWFASRRYGIAKLFFYGKNRHGRAAGKR